MQEAGAWHAASAGGAGLVGLGVQGGEGHGRLLQGVGSCRGLTSHQAPSAQLKGRIETGMRHAIPYLQFIPRRERSGESPYSSSPTCCSAVRDGGAGSRRELGANKGTSLGIRQMHTHMGGKRGLAHETSDGDMLESPQTKKLCPTTNTPTCRALVLALPQELVPSISGLREMLLHLPCLTSPFNLASHGQLSDGKGFHACPRAPARTAIPAGSSVRKMRTVPQLLRCSTLPRQGGSPTAPQPPYIAQLRMRRVTL